MEIRPNRALQFRMALTLAAFAAFVAATLLLSGGVGAVIATGMGFVPAVGVTVGVGVPLTAAVVEARDGIGVPSDATPVEPTHELQRVVDRLAKTADVPAPRVHLREDDTPIVFVVGARPSTSRLVVSTGVVEAVDDEGLEAVFSSSLTQNCSISNYQTTNSHQTRFSKRQTPTATACPIQ